MDDINGRGSVSRKRWVLQGSAEVQVQPGP